MQLEKTLELDSNFGLAYSSLALAYQARRDYAARVEAGAKVFDLTRRPEYAELARESLAEGGWEGHLRKMMKLRPELWAYTRVAFHAALGEMDEAFGELNKEYENRESFLVRLKVDPRFDTLRDDPSCQELLRKIGDPQ